MRCPRCPGSGERRCRCHGRGLTRQRTRMAETIALLEQLQIDQRPEQLLVVLPPAFMFGQQPLDLATVAELAREGTRRIDMIADEVPHRATEPFVDGHAKT